MVKKIQMTIIAQYTVAQNQAANSVIPCSMIIDPQTGSVQRYPIPTNEVWVIEDVYKTGSINVDAVVQFIKNDFETLFITDPLSTLDVSNPAKPRYDKKILKGNDALTLKAINLVAGSSSGATTDKFYIKVTRYAP